LIWLWLNIDGKAMVGKVSKHSNKVWVRPIL